MKRNRALLDLLLMLVLILPEAGVCAREMSPSDFPVFHSVGTADEPAEAMILQIDRGKYIAGENIWFSIFNLDTESEKLSGNSIIAYVELLNPWNNPVVQHRFRIEGGRGDGNLAIPDTVSSGTYIVRAYTNHMKNFLPLDCFMHEIEIYNPFRSKDLRMKMTSRDTSFPGPLAFLDKDMTTVNVTSDTVYGTRQKVTLTLGITNNNSSKPGISDLSIAIAPAEASGINHWPEYQIATERQPGRYAFEVDGHYLYGNVRYRDRTISDSSDFLFMSVQGKVAEFRYARIDSAGRFSFVLPVDSKSRNLILQPEHATRNMILEIEPSFPGIYPDSKAVREIIPDSLLEIFSGLSFNYQASRIYGTKLKEDIEETDNSLTKRRRFYGIPEMEVRLDDYIKLPTMQEVFFELVPGIIIRERRPGYDLKITNPLTGKFYDEPPLVMIDGVIINDLKALVDLDPETVERIEVVKTPYLTGDMVLHGIVNVITRSGDFSRVTMPDYAVILPYRVIDKPAVFISPDYSDDQARLSRKPDLRNTLYWNPSVKTNSNGIAEITFWTSDLPGTYRINILGIVSDGSKIEASKEFEVR